MNATIASGLRGSLKIAIALCAVALSVGIPTPGRGYDVETRYCQYGYVSGYAYTHRADAVGGATVGTCGSYYLAYWNMCDGGSPTYSASLGWWGSGGVGYYSYCGSILMWTTNTHQGSEPNWGNTPIFYTEEYAGP